jgi:hypothetical protein
MAGGTTLTTDNINNANTIITPNLFVTSFVSLPPSAPYWFSVARSYVQPGTLSTGGYTPGAAPLQASNVGYVSLAGSIKGPFTFNFGALRLYRFFFAIHGGFPVLGGPLATPCSGYIIANLIAGPGSPIVASRQDFVWDASGTAYMTLVVQLFYLPTNAITWDAFLYSYPGCPVSVGVNYAYVEISTMGL